MAWRSFNNVIFKMPRIFVLGCNTNNYLIRFLNKMQLVRRNFCVGKSFPENENKNLFNLKSKLEDNSWTSVDKTDNLLEKTSTKIFKYTFLVLGISVTIFGTLLIFEFNGIKQKGNMLEECTKFPAWKQHLFNFWQQLETFAIFIQEPSRDKLLPDPVEYPYYQPPYTLVMEFTDVLAHPDWTYKTGWRFKKRPGVDFLLENLVGLYEIVIFTAEPGITIFPVIESLDQKNLISYKLVRDSTHFVDGHHVKNLEKLNRDLKKVIVIDWNAESVKFHPDNHLQISQWKGLDEDRDLIDLTAFLKTIAHTEIEDVRDVLKFYKQYDNPLREFKIKQREFFSNQGQQKSELPKTQSIKRVLDYIM